MDARKLAKLRSDLAVLRDEVVGSLGHPRRRHACGAYVRGVLLDGPRKSVEPTAARRKAIGPGGEDDEQAVRPFLSPSPGGRAGGARFRIIDDTGFPKPGGHSVGVARPYTGTLGPVARGPVAVTLPLATAAHVVALDARLYLPQAWAADRDRMTKAGAPAAVDDQPKWQMAPAMVRRAAANGFGRVVLADRLFGTVTAFREGRTAGRTAWASTRRSR